MVIQICKLYKFKAVNESQLLIGLLALVNKRIKYQ